MSYSYERSSKTLNEAYYSDSDSSDSYRGANSKGSNSSRTPYLGGPSFARADPSYARADPEQNLIASQRLPPMKEVPYMPVYRQSNYKDSRCYIPNNHCHWVPSEESEIRPGTLLGRSDEEIYADLDRIVNGDRNRRPRDDTPSMTSDHTSPSPSTPSIASPPVSPGRDPSPPPHIERHAYPQGYYGHKIHDSTENALVFSTEHMRIEPGSNVAQARVPSHYPVQVESSFAQSETPPLYITQAEYYPPIATRSIPQAKPTLSPDSVHAEPSRAIRVIGPSRNIPLMPSSSLGTERQAWMIESSGRVAPQPALQPANPSEHPKAVAKPLARLRTLAPRIITTNATETRATEIRTMDTGIIEPRNTPTHSLRVDKAKALNQVDTSRLNLLADSALGSNHNDEKMDELDEDSEVTHLPAVKRQKAQNLEKPPRPPPQKKRGRYECKLCSQIFTRNFDLTRHVRTIHEARPEGDVLSRTCPACGEVQSRDDSHKRHMVLVPASCERQARILGKPAPAKRSDSFYEMCRARVASTV